MSDPSGEPLEAAEVILLAEPPLEVKQAMEPGDEFESIPIARGRADAEGNFELRAERDGPVAARLTDDGLDVELFVVGDRERYSDFTQVIEDPTSGGWIADLDGQTPRERRDDLERANEEGQLSRSAAATEPNDLNRRDVVFGQSIAVPADVVEPDEPDAEPLHHHPNIGGCSSWTLEDTSYPLQTIATAGVRNGVTARTTYSANASTTTGVGLGVAANSQWAGVSYEQSGTRTRASGLGVNFTQYTAPVGGALVFREYRLEWRHDTSERHCGVGHSLNYDAERRTEPIAASGGARHFTSMEPNFDCPDPASVVGVDEVSTESATAATYQEAFTLSPGPLGGLIFSGTSQSGYDANTRVHYNFNQRPGAHLWCGNTEGGRAPALSPRTKAWIPQ